jgi:26S proteasome regulatory subunit N8
MVEVKEYELSRDKVSSTPTKVIVHPLVLLSAVDHYNRVAKDTSNRVVGVLLGEVDKWGNVDVLNSFGVPFEEDSQNPDVWFLDCNFLDNMFAMFRKVSARERIIGWYSTGPKISKSDIDIHKVFMERYLKHPVYVIIDVKMSGDTGSTIPTDAYYAVMEREDELSQPKLTFKHVDSEIGALEAEEIGVEHLLRDVKDVNISSLTASVDNRLSGLKALKTRLSEIDKYLSQVISDKMPINQSIIYQLQNIFNLLPRLDDEKQKSFITKTNDAMMIMYLSSMLRSVVSLHDLIENKISLREEEVKLAKQQQEKQKNTKKTASNASKPEEDQKTSFSD